MNNQTCKYEPYIETKEESESLQNLRKIVEDVIEKAGIQIAAILVLLFLLLRKRVGRLFDKLMQMFPYVGINFKERVNSKNCKNNLFLMHLNNSKWYKMSLFLTQLKAIGIT